MGNIADKQIVARNKYASRKWIVCVWAMALFTVIVLASIIISLLGKSVPEGSLGFSSSLIVLILGYLGVNAYQATHFKSSDTTSATVIK